MAGVGGMGLRDMGLQALLLLVMCAAGAQGLYVYIGKTEKRCFIEEIPDETMVIRNYGTQIMALFAGGKLRVHLDIQVGEHANNYPEIAAKDKLTELQLCAQQLLDQVEQIQKEQDYRRYREECFHLTSESTNQRVLWWSIAQTVILILTGRCVTSRASLRPRNWCSALSL
ncbi:Transmembrane emp24 domain-containing protein 4 [Sciurus carolinensis]|uniref:Transmembrane emp24 domain-containing protein 4 n=1 Tax=Sciurus carolinensis TaxID=30640 RepID=A0AA41NIK6_SCICA|nr:Transmembrane emp24 domain-containing protein 4 [Sciurus carolinensis]